VRLFFFFQAEDGIRDRNVTGVQTCALPIYPALEASCGVAHPDPALRRRCICAAPTDSVPGIARAAATRYWVCRGSLAVAGVPAKPARGGFSPRTAPRS